jgi:hypothetical protein
MINQMLLLISKLEVMSLNPKYIIHPIFQLNIPSYVEGEFELTRDGEC